MLNPTAMLSLAALLLSGCLSHLPPRSTTHLQIHWARDFSAAAAEAEESHKPILACLVAGQIDGPC